MKVLIVSHMYPSSFNSMAGIFVHKQVKALSQQGHEFKVVSPVPYSPGFLGRIKKRWADYSNIPKRACMEGIDIYYPRYLEFPRSFLLGYSGYFMHLGIRKLVKDIYSDFKFDLIHSHVGLPDGFSSILLNKVYGVPHLLTIHGQDLQVTINRNSTSRNNLMKVLKSVDGIITVSEKLRALLNEDLRGKARVIYNGIDLSELQGEMDPVEDKESETIILSVSNLNKTKGIDLNIRAFASLVRKFPNIRYHIIGDGNERDNIKRLIDELNLKDKVFLLGRLPHKEVIDHMKSCAIFSLPSYIEGFGVVYLEAMACGKPIIGVEGEGISEVIKDGINGFLVKPQNIEDIENRIEYLLSNPVAARDIGQRAKNQARTEFSWEVNSKGILDFYEDILRDRK